ncbi:YtxH domain-containing protein [Paenibacillus koleovorans]|uniref:YtxH domain-containing protein n=1 Tax=Paenibacillus koleovorans TaxID=121608 RepID=UPI000FDB8080|nr:YtxH domain-containing protein [Paenibacillus koleovorans]
MRFGSFLLGGLVGAGAIMFWNRRGKHMTFAAISHQADRMMDNMKDKGNQVRRAASHKMDKLDKIEPEIGDGLDQVKAFVDGDPELKKQVDEMIHSQAH